MSEVILAPRPAFVWLVAAAALLIAAIVVAALCIRSNVKIRAAMDKLSTIEKSLEKRSARRRKESAAFVAEIRAVQHGGTAATNAVEKIVGENYSPLSKEGMAEDNALTAALFPLYAQEKAYPELYLNEKVSAATKSLKEADSAFESDRKAYNAACVNLQRQTSTRSGRVVAKMHGYSAPPIFPDP